MITGNIHPTSTMPRQMLAAPTCQMNPAKTTIPAVALSAAGGDSHSRARGSPTLPSYNLRAMLPASLQTPAAVILLFGGLLACFAGYRIFRIVLGIYGFILGALLATSIVGTESTWLTVAASLGGGLAGALLLIAAYFVGVALIGAALGALAANLLWAAMGGSRTSSW